MENGDLKCLPVPIVKKIIKELISCDSAKVMLELTEKELNLTEKKVSLKDSIINTMGEKEKNYVNIISLSDQKFITLSNYNKTLESNYAKINLQLKVAKTKNKIKNVVITSGLTIAIGYTAFWYFFLK